MGFADQDSMTIGAELRKAREQAGISQEELAKRAKVSRVYISQLEGDTGKSISLDIFMRLAEGMGIKPSTLLARIEKSQ